MNYPFMRKRIQGVDVVFPHVPLSADSSLEVRPLDWLCVSFDGSFSQKKRRKDFEGSCPILTLLVNLPDKPC